MNSKSDCENECEMRGIIVMHAADLQVTAVGNSCGLHHTMVVRYGKKWPQSPKQCSVMLVSLLTSNVVIEQFARHTLSEAAYSLPI
jgi:hypothetical protein